MATSNKNFKVKNGLDVSGTATASSFVKTGGTSDEFLMADGSVSAGGGGGSLEVSQTPPSSPSEGDIWYNSQTGQTFVYYDSFWVENISGIAGPEGPTGPIGETGLVAQSSEPVDTSTLWLDTDEDGVGIPLGGTTGQVLAKVDSVDFNTEWTSNTLANLDDVDVPSPGNGTVLTYNPVSAKWVAQPISIPNSTSNSIQFATTTYDVDLLVDSNQVIENMPTTLDGVSGINKVVLLVGQTNTAENGFYVYDTKTPTWYRNDGLRLKLGATVYVKSGTVYTGSVWILTSYVQWTNGFPQNIGSTPLVFEPYTPSVQADLDAKANLSGGNTFSGTQASSGSFTSTSTSLDARFIATNTASGSSDYVYLLSGINDTGTKAVHFINSSTRTLDGGQNSYVIRNDGGSLILGNSAFTTTMNSITNMPFQPAFFVAKENDSGTSAGNKITFNYIGVNTNSCWSSANNRFTAPVSGRYFFTHSILNTGTSPLYLLYRKNGTTMNMGEYPRSYTGVQYESNTASGIIQLAANDYIEMWVDTGGVHGFHNFFSGYLIG